MSIAFDWLYQVYKNIFAKGMAKMDHPKVTVLMPVYNSAPFVAEAIESILNQTFVDFEFLIINDGSTDQSVEIIRSYKDPRIVLVQNPQNLGLIATLNRGLDLAHGEYIARMDSDDISYPERLAKQVKFMDYYPDVGVCGTWIEFSDSRSVFGCAPDHESIVRGLVEHTQLAHPSVMIRTKVLRRERLYYDPNYPHAEDYELWVRMSKITRLANIPEVLVWYRIHPGQISSIYESEQRDVAERIREKLREG